MTLIQNQLKEPGWIVRDVQRLYETFPYPHYPLLARPHYQDGYLAASQFAGHLYQNATGHEAAIHRERGRLRPNGRSVLVVGSGEILPYVIRKLEPSYHRLLCVDLSQRTIRRARFRLAADYRRTEFIHSEINDFLRKQGLATGPYAHIDVYGVLHHLADPATTLELLAHRLAPHGTMRLMVYNSEARNWIHHIQRIFRLLKLSAYEPDDRKSARDLLNVLATANAVFRQLLSQMGPQLIDNDTRFVDTFFHAREAVISLGRWFSLFEKVGLTPYGLFDRYAELDDLPNPLWSMPSFKELEERTSDRRFENNLELYLCRSISKNLIERKTVPVAMESRWSILGRYLQRPPRNWFSFKETEGIGWADRWHLWHRHSEYVVGTETESIDELCYRMEDSALKRLARMGAIFPGQFKDRKKVESLIAPLADSMEPLEVSKPQSMRGSDVSQYIMDELQKRSLFSERRFSAIMDRLLKAQILAKTQSGS